LSNGVQYPLVSLNHMTYIPLNDREIGKLERFLSRSPKCLILPHAKPDGDAIGAASGLYLGLKSLGIDADLACMDAVPEEFRFIAETSQYKTDFDLADYDGVFFVDCGNKKLTGFQESKPEIFNTTDRTVINIDHHPSNDEFGNINFKITDMASASMIVFKVLEGLGAKIDPDTATALLLGIYTDTGGFMHQNTTPLTYLHASELVKLGANYKRIAREVFQKHDFCTLKLWGKVLQNLHVTKDGAAIVGVEEADYKNLGCRREDLGGVIDFVNSMPEARYSVLLSEDGNGNVKASLRTRDDSIDVKALAEKFGGGGHVKAAGFTIKGGHLEKEVKWKIVQE